MFTASDLSIFRVVYAGGFRREEPPIEMVRLPGFGRRDRYQDVAGHHIPRLFNIAIFIS
jgi:hypothetical protein